MNDEKRDLYLSLSKTQCVCVPPFIHSSSHHGVDDLLSRSSSLLFTHRLLTHDVNGAHVAAAHPQETVQRAALAVQARAVALDLAAAVQHDLRAEREVFHQHPPVVHHLTLTLAAHDEAYRETDGRIFTII